MARNGSLAVRLPGTLVERAAELIAVMDDLRDQSATGVVTVSDVLRKATREGLAVLEARYGREEAEYGDGLIG